VSVRWFDADLATGIGAIGSLQIRQQLARSHFRSRDQAPAALRTCSSKLFHDPGRRVAFIPPADGSSTDGSPTDCSNGAEDTHVRLVWNCAQVRR